MNIYLKKRRCPVIFYLVYCEDNLTFVVVVVCYGHSLISKAENAQNRFHKRYLGDLKTLKAFKKM